MEPEKSKNQEKTAKKRIKWYDRNAENDIRFRGPLSYRHFKIIAWCLIALTPITLVLSMASLINANIAELGTLNTVITVFTSMALPLMLLANFSAILNSDRGCKKKLVLYGALAVGVYLIFLFVYKHYVVGVTELFVKSGDAEGSVASFFDNRAKNGFFAFNLFIDLFLCTLLTFFLNHRPEKVFTGKKLLIFRAFALLPILYEIGSIILKILASLDKITLSPFIYPLLTTKPPMSFFVFVLLVSFIKFRETRYLKRGKTLEDFKAYLKTRYNSLHFSISATVAILFAAALDLIALIVLTIIAMPAGLTEEQANTAIAELVYKFVACGFGETVGMVMIIPFVMFFSYTKEYKNKTVDLIIPAGGVALTVLVGLECFYQVLRLLVTEFF